MCLPVHPFHAQLDQENRHNSKILAKNIRETMVNQTTIRRVRFFTEAKVRVVDSHRDYSPEEHAAAWISKQDKQKFKLDMQVTTICTRKNLLNNSVQNEDEYCIRGLERFIKPSGSRIVREKRRMLVRAVLDEQKAAAKQANADLRIKAVSFNHTGQCRHAASELGREDAKFVQDMIKQEYFKTVGLEEMDDFARLSKMVGVLSLMRQSNNVSHVNRQPNRHTPCAA